MRACNGCMDVGGCVRVLGGRRRCELRVLTRATHVSLHLPCLAQMEVALA